MRRNEIIDSINEKKRYLEIFTDGLDDLVSNILAPMEEQLSDDKIQSAGAKLSDIDEDIDIIIKKFDEALDDLQKENIWDEFNEALIKMEVIGRLDERVVLYHEMLPKEHWKLKLYPRNARSKERCYIKIEFDIKQRKLHLNIQACDVDNAFIEIGYFIFKDGKFDYILPDKYHSHMTYKLHKHLSESGNAFKGLEKILSILNDYINGENIIEKYFDISEYYSIKNDLHSIKFYEACMINFLNLFGGDIKYYQYSESSYEEEGSDIIQTLSKTADLLSRRFEDKIEWNEGYVDIEEAFHSKSLDLIFKNYNKDHIIILEFSNDSICVISEDRILGFILYNELFKKYKFKLMTYLSEHEKKEIIKQLPDDFNDILVKLNDILLNALSFNKSDWYKYVEDRLRVLTYTENSNICSWLEMIKELVNEKFEMI